MHVRTRKAIGCFALLTYMVVYAGLAASVGVALAPSLPNWAELLYYAGAEVVLIVQLKPLCGSMTRP